MGNISTFDFSTLVAVAVAGLFLGIFIMLIGIKLYISLEYPQQFSEPDDWPDEDWVIGYEVKDDES